MANTIVYNKFDYVQRLRARINKPSTWKDVMNVMIKDVRSIVNGYPSTEPSVQSGTRGSAYTYQDMVLANDTLTINVYRVLPVFIDEADRHQQSYVDQMKIADFQGKKIDEYVEAQMLAQHASFKDFGVTDLAGGAADDTTQITVSASNIDDIIRAVKRKLYQNNGVEFAVEKGIFFVWRPEDFELLEAFAQANGYTVADMALKSGIPVQRAFHYMGVDHYLSTQHTADHIMAGIKGMFEIGILRGTYGQVKTIEDPAKVSGVGMVSRLDYGWNLSSYYGEFVVDLNVA